jgi:hypothetical protein
VGSRARWRCIVALLALIALLLLVASAGASELRPAPPATGRGTSADREGRYAIYKVKGGLRILSDATGQETTLAVPEGCGFSGMGEATLAFICRGDKSLRLYDLTAGTWSEVPRNAPVNSLFDPDGVPSLTVGKVWIRADGYASCHRCGPYFHHFRRDTGEAGPRDPESARVYDDLDDQRLWTPLCSPLRRPPSPTFDDFDDHVRFAAPWMIGRTMVTLEAGHDKSRVTSRRCGSRRETLVTRSPHAHHHAIGARFVTWVEGRYAVAHEIATKRVRRWRIPGPARQSVYVSSTRRRVFVDKRDARGVASRRFVATLP